MSRKYFNGIKTMGLFVGLWVVMLGFGAVIGGGKYLPIFGAISLVMTAFGYWNSDKLAIRAMGARPVTEVEQPAMYRIVRELSAEAKQPMPRLYVSPTEAPNAFATGRSPQKAAVCCTEGILKMLSERELRGVLGHELMHVYNRDILIGSVAAAFAGMITMAAQMMYFAGMFGGGDRNDRGNANPFVLIGMLILAPIAASLIRLAITRTREYDADEDGARLTRDPLSLANALRKLDEGVAARPLQPTSQLENVSHLMIANPFRGVGMARLFQTHPPMEDRISRLEDMAAEYGTAR
jgi:heat shock protein HtpX